MADWLFSLEHNNIPEIFLLYVLLCFTVIKGQLIITTTVEPQYHEVPRDWQNLFTIMRFCQIEVFFHIFYYYWGKQNLLL